MSNFTESKRAPDNAIHAKIVGCGITQLGKNGVPVGTHVVVQVGNSRAILELGVEDSMRLLKMLEDAAKEEPLIFRRTT